MAFNVRLGRFTFALFFMLIIPAVFFAQEEMYFLDTSGEQPRFFQRLEWRGDEYAMSYGVVVQRIDDKRTEVWREETKETYLNVSLHPGKYRYTVVTLDFLGHPGEWSAWRYFEIFTAFQPRIEKFYPPLFFLDRNHTNRVLDIAGVNLLEESEIYLRNENGSVFPVERKVWGGKRATLYFEEDLPVGTYDICVRNPSGLEAATEGFIIGYSKPVDLFVKAGWAPLIPIYGKMHDIFGSDFYMAGTTFSFEAVTSKRSVLNGGLEISASLYSLNSITAFHFGMEEIINSYIHTGTTASLVEACVNILLQKQFFNRKMAATLKFGIGFSSIDFSNPPESELVLQWNAGLSYLVFLYEILYLEAGAEYVHHDTDETSGFIKPKLTVGWQF